MCDKNRLEYYDINGFKVKNNNYYLYKNERKSIHTSLREDLYIDLVKLSKQKKKPMSKIFDVIYMTFKDNPQIYKEFLKNLRNY